MQEDKMIFPSIFSTNKEIIDSLARDHRKLEEYLENFSAYCNEFEEDFKKFDIKTFKEHACKIQIFLLPHLEFEESKINSKTLKQLFPGKADVLRSILVEIHNDNRGRGKNSTELAFFISHLNEDEKSIVFANVPFLVKNVLFPLYCWIHSDWWTFSKCEGGINKNFF
jgi:hypothetical protein